MILYINGNIIQLEKSNPIPLTKQVNTIGSLSTRQNDFVQNIKAPLTSKNNVSLDYLSSAGTNSQVPYNRNSAKLFTNEGDAVINNGFAVVKKTDQFYNITIYEGIITFWKRIENISLKDIGLPNLNHLRNVANIVDSLENKLDYRYLISDYNGKFLADSGELNADYLIPSALVSYIWSRVFEYAGYTFTGDIFNSDAFNSMYVTYPKSIGSDDQQITLLHTETFITQTVDPFFPNPSGGGFITFYYNYLFKEEISTNIYVESFGNYNEIVEVKTSGRYQFKLNGFIGFPETESSYGIYYWINDPANPVDLLNNIDRTTNIDLTVDLTLEIGDRVFFGFSSSIFVFGGTDLDVSDLDLTINLVEGDNIDFEESFIDFKCTDFIKEIMWQFSLTPFTSRFSNSILFLTEDEKYLENDVVDWSGKFVQRESAEYDIGYAQKNDFKYRYNNENENHSDGNILINNVNLQEENTVIQSVTYSPERFYTFLGSERLLQVKMWEKDIQDDGSIEYKDLRKRFHFLRQEEISGSITIESEIFANSETTTQAKKAVFNTLTYDNIIARYYNSTRTVLNDTKLETVYLKINSIEATGLDLTKRYYFKQLGGDFVINKMTNYVENKPTKFELLKINTKQIINQPPDDVPTFIEITGSNIESCSLTLDVDTNISQPETIQIRCVNAFVDPATNLPLWDLFFDVDLENNQVTFDLNLLPLEVIFDFWRFSLKSQNTVSNQTEALSIGSCGVQTNPPPTETITITSIQTTGVVNNVRTVRIFFTTDFVLPNDFTLTITPGLIAPQDTSPQIIQFTGQDFVDANVIHSGTSLTFPGIRYYWNFVISKNNIESNLVTSTT